MSVQIPGVDQNRLSHPDKASALYQQSLLIQRTLSRMEKGGGVQDGYCVRKCFG